MIHFLFFVAAASSPSPIQEALTNESIQLEDMDDFRLEESAPIHTVEEPTHEDTDDNSYRFRLVDRCDDRFRIRQEFDDGSGRIDFKGNKFQLRYFFGDKGHTSLPISDRCPSVEEAPSRDLLRP